MGDDEIIGDGTSFLTYGKTPLAKYHVSYNKRTGLVRMSLIEDWNFKTWRYLQRYRRRGERMKKHHTK